MDAIAARFAEVLERQQVTGPTVVALSGGIDSMVLLEIAAAWARSHHGVHLEALHVHHGLSPNADAWAAFCERECAARAVPLKVVRVAIDRADTGGQGVEAAARAARYRAFVDSGAHFILAAQHADDQAETVLHQLLRGTGWAGLAGMGETRVLAPHTVLVRPFLGLERGVLEQYARAQGLAWIEDESNDDVAYTRNYLRHRVLPAIAERFPHFRASLSRAARHAAEADELLEALARIDLAWQDGVAHADALDALPPARQVNALYHWLRWLGIPPPSHAQLIEWARQLFRPTPTDRPHQAGGHEFRIVRKEGTLRLVIAGPGPDHH
ncbi:MAG: tRNA lysidine(34) synthetase TilS [Betaproteobacteria bacterium]|nr:tRNA lysidine(34) synthetase TilS [Betaproteobacteria bacterium]